MTAPDLDKHFRPEALHPDLVACLEETTVINGVGMTVLRHPLVYGVPYLEPMHRHYNALLSHKQVALRDARARGDWHQAIYLHERPYRVQALDDFAHQMTDREYWGHLSGVWEDSENIYQERDRWARLLQSTRRGRRRWGWTAPDRQLIGKAVTLHVYRGTTTAETTKRLLHLVDPSFLGWSWTLSPEKAKWFAQRSKNLHGGSPRVLQGHVEARYLLLAVSGRNEQEVVFNPKHLTALSLLKE